MTWTRLLGNVSLAALLCAVASGVGCRCRRTGGTDGAAASASAAASSLPSGLAAPTADAGPPPPTPEELASWQACAERRKALEAEPALPGAPAYEELRVHLARIRGRTVLWRRPPKAASSELDERLSKNDSALKAVRGLLRDHKATEARRKVFLREGYLYEERVDVGLAMVDTLGLTDLFDEPALYLQRGALLYELKRLERTRYLPERYTYQDGPLRGETAEILAGDRVGLTRAEAESEPLVIDLVDAQRRSDWDRIRPARLTEQALGADLRYGPDTWVPAVLELDGPRAKLACEALTPELAARKRAFVAELELEKRALRRLRQVIREEVREQIPFDWAPESENGFLRRDWEKAYLGGARRFTSRDRKFDVYNPEGKPIPPQVCIDFISDTWERAAGSWYEPMSGDPLEPHPKREPGPINLRQADLKNRRSVYNFVRFTKKHPELFDTWDLPKKERVPFEKRAAFYEYLAKNPDQFRPGDVLILYGTKEGGRPHYHSLFIFETDPVTGVPTRVAGNAVFPREQTLEGIMQISPKRTIRHRIRLLRPWLELIAAQAPEGELAVDEGAADPTPAPAVEAASTGSAGAPGRADPSGLAPATPSAGAPARP
jgi:hypothetical protein